MTRDALYERLQTTFERDARPEAQATFRWVHAGMAERLEPAALATFARLVAREPLSLTDEHFDALRREGLDDAALFEIVAAAALGAGLARRRRALTALRGGAAP